MTASMPGRELAAGAARTGCADLCHHCGSPNPSSLRWRVTLAGTERAFCCAGCLAIAQTLQTNGFGAFYASRGEGVFARPDAQAVDERAFAAADVVARDWVRALDASRREAPLLLEGLRCGACAWLVETWLARQPGIESFDVNYTTGRARVVWREPDTSLPGILRAVAALGYRAHPYDPARRETLARDERRALLLRMAVAVLAMMQVMMLAVPTYLDAAGVAPEHRALLDWASLTLTLPAIAYAALPFFRGAWRDVSNGRLGMDVPVAIGLAAAFAASAWSTLRGGGPVYYDSVTMFIALLLVARYVELAGRQRAGEAIERIARARPPVAERLTGWPRSDAVETVIGSDLKGGDFVLVRPGAGVPADGVVVDGVSHVEEAVLTGESWPRAKREADEVLAGSVNREGALVVRVTAAGDATRLAAIVRLVDRAACVRPAIARAADRFAAVFVALLFALAFATAALWWQIDPSRALEVTFALLVVSCPCALSLATPAAVAASLGALSTRQALVSRPDALQALARVTHVVFDKTGTLTLGHVELHSQLVLDRADRGGVLAIAAALEARSEHPVARALKAAFRGTTPLATDVTVVPGGGVEGAVEGLRYRIGRPAFVTELSGPLPGAALEFIKGASEHATIAVLGSAGGVHAVFALGDALRPGAAASVDRLVAQGITPVLLSGDRASAARWVGRALGIADARGDLSPEHKAAVIAGLQAGGAVVAMVGDGVNDAPGLAQAQVSVTLGSATPLAQWTSDIIVLSDALPTIALAVDHARRTLRIVRQNLGWSFAYNALAIPAAAFGHVTPLVAAAGMSLSSLLVVCNSLRAARIVAPPEPGPPAPLSLAIPVTP